MPDAPEVYAVKSPDGIVTRLEVIPAAKPSPAGSSVGFLWATWFKKQLPDLKKLVSYLSAAATVWATSLNLPPFLQPYASLIAPALGIVIGIATRAALDWLDYRYSSNPQ